MNNETKRHSDLTPEETRRERREDAKEGVKEFMQECMQNFGIFSLKFLGVAGLGALVIFILTMDGWKK
jgi:hypothetical protein